MPALAAAAASHSIAQNAVAPGTDSASSTESADAGAESGGKALVAVVFPGEGAVGGEGGEPLGRQGAEERVQLAPGGGVVEAVLRGGNGIGEGEAEGVVVDEAKGEGGASRGHRSGEQGREESLGEGE